MADSLNRVMQDLLCKQPTRYQHCKICSKKPLTDRTFFYRHPVLSFEAPISDVGACGRFADPCAFDGNRQGFLLQWSSMLFPVVVFEGVSLWTQVFRIPRRIWRCCLFMCFPWQPTGVLIVLVFHVFHRSCAQGGSLWTHLFPIPRRMWKGCLFVHLRL